ncbi:TRPM8 channel-associated factor homolog [Polypterus senegalus]|uniref:TRPM8 channel-associated factor homolog n=1 Tax=Polypterus senegalus TaxID=55291 RepID=UPI0019625D45|nr:TRPM8 channel-associated factor homolog [Polypterus senegalus]
MARQTAYEALVKGIQEFDFTGPNTPCDLILADHAIPVAINKKGQVLIAASQYGKGRLVVLTHEAYMSDPKFSQFVQNAITWLKPQPDALVGVSKTLTEMFKSLSCKDGQVVSEEFRGDMGVYCLKASDIGDDKQLIEYLKKGGGLLIAGQAWEWSEQQNKDVFYDYPGNKVTSVASVYFNASKGEKEVCSVTEDIPRSWHSLVQGRDFSNDLKVLQNDVKEFDIRGAFQPSHLLVHGPLAFPIAYDAYERPFLAGALYGKGRIVVLTRDNHPHHPPLKTFMLNAMRWLGATPNGKIGVENYLSSFYKLLKEEQFNCELSDTINDVSVYCCTSYEADEVLQFVAEGGGLLIAGQCWNWAKKNPDLSELTDYPGNKILNRAGITCRGYIYSPGTYVVPQPEERAKSYLFLRSLAKFVFHICDGTPLEKEESDRWRRVIEDGVQFLKLKAEDNFFYTSIHRLLTDTIEKLGVPQTSKTNMAKPIKDRLLIDFAPTLYNVIPNPQKLLPIIIPNIPVLPTLSSVSVEVDGTNKGGEAWRSTGMYISPGESATLEFPTEVLGLGWQVQIGCHSDNLEEWDDLCRAAVVIRRFRVNAKRVSVSNLWGGLIYIIIPEGCQIGTVNVSIENAVSAPYFVFGKSSNAKWTNSIRNHPAPWAELEANNIILTVPSDSIRTLDDPESLLRLWNDLMKSITELAAIPETFPRKERIVADIQISAGWMHAGYPIMIHLPSLKYIIDEKVMRKEGLWGPIHELGHNQQQDGWEFRPYTKEATCNLWSVYVNEKVLNISRELAAGDYTMAYREGVIKAYLGKGAKLENWTTWTCLETYMQLQEAFGWEPYIQLFSDYQKITNISSDVTVKMNMWVERFSNEVKKNLVPFFKAWGFPITDEVSARLASLPEWDENPMKKYL